MLLTAKNTWRKTVNVKTGFPTETQDGDKSLAKQLKGEFGSVLERLSTDHSLLEKCVELRNLPSASYSEPQWQLLEALMRFLPKLLAHLMVVFQQTQVLFLTS